jgi:hypothetical protein
MRVRQTRHSTRYHLLNLEDLLAAPHGSVTAVPTSHLIHSSDSRSCKALVGILDNCYALCILWSNFALVSHILQEGLNLDDPNHHLECSVVPAYSASTVGCAKDSEGGHRSVKRWVRRVGVERTRAAGCVRFIHTLRPQTAMKPTVRTPSRPANCLEQRKRAEARRENCGNTDTDADG